MQNTCPVIMYPEGVKVGTVTSGKRNKTAKVRHVAKDVNGNRVGTFDTYKLASEALITLARGEQELDAIPQSREG